MYVGFRTDRFEMPKRLPTEEIAQRGDAIFEHRIAPTLDAPVPSRFVAIDVESGDYEIADTERGAVKPLRARHADPQVWLRRVDGQPVRRIGGHRIR